MKKKYILILSILCIMILIFFLWNFNKEEQVQSKEFESISDVLTFDEMIACYAENVDITFDEASGYFSRNLSEDKEATYRELNVELEVDSNYRPYIAFYCKTDETSEEWEIVSICSVQLVNSYNGTCKDFNGNLEVWLRTGTQIEYAVNGDFINDGNPLRGCMEYSEVEMGENLKKEFTGPSVSQTFKYFYEHVFYNIR